MRKMSKSYRLMCVIAAAAFLAGCGGDDDDYSKYVTLGDYKNLSAELAVAEVTEEELEEYVQEYLAEFQSYHYSNDPISDGQYVETSLTAKAGKEMIYDFGEDGYELIVGDEEFGAEVDAQLIGRSAGDELDFSVSYEDDFEDVLLAGKDVSYHIEVLKVADIIYPELTDEFVAENYEEETVEAWKQTLYEELYSNHQAEATEELRDNLLEQVIEGSKIDGYPKALYKQQKQMLDADYQSYADMFGCSLDDVYEMLEMDEDTLKEEYLNATYQVMVLTLIQQQENITLSEDELQEQLEEFAQYNEYDSVEELLADYEKEDLESYFLQEMTLDFLEEHADVAITTVVGEE